MSKINSMCLWLWETAGKLNTVRLDIQITIKVDPATKYKLLCLKISTEGFS